MSSACRISVLQGTGLLGGILCTQDSSRSVLLEGWKASSIESEIRLSGLEQGWKKSGLHP